MMNSKITSQIKISVQPKYEPRNSYPLENRFVFSYHITIENLGNSPVKLLKRKWQIFDVAFGFTEVAGDGVIGLLPEIQAGGSFSYFSNVILRSGVGNMAGSYLLKDLETNGTFEAEIPQFYLFTDILQN